MAGNNSPNNFQNDITQYYMINFPNYIYICDTLRNLVQSVQFRKREEHP